MLKCEDECEQQVHHASLPTLTVLSELPDTLNVLSKLPDTTLHLSALRATLHT